MTDRSRDGTYDDTPTVLSLILHEGRELRDKQDTKLRSLRQLSTGALIVLLSAGTIAVAASTPLAPAVVVIVFGIAIMLAVCTAIVEVAAAYWHEGPEINGLMDDFYRPGPAAR